MFFFVCVFFVLMTNSTVSTASPLRFKRSNKDQTMPWLRDCVFALFVFVFVLNDKIHDCIIHKIEILTQRVV